MTSQKGAPACWGSNEALPRAPSPSMQPAGQPLHAIPPGRPGPAHWLRAPTLPAHHVRAARQVLTPNMALLLWRRDINAWGLYDLVVSVFIYCIDMSVYILKCNSPPSRYKWAFVGESNQGDSQTRFVPHIARVTKLLRARKKQVWNGQ